HPTLSLHDALPIFALPSGLPGPAVVERDRGAQRREPVIAQPCREAGDGGGRGVGIPRDLCDRQGAGAQRVREERLGDGPHGGVQLGQALAQLLEGGGGTWGHFRALSVMARTKPRWNIRKTSRIGRIDRTAAAIDRPGAIAPVSSTKLVSPSGRVYFAGSERNTSGVS